MSLCSPSREASTSPVEKLPSPSVTDNDLDPTGKHLKWVQLGLQARSFFCETGFGYFPCMKLTTNVKHLAEGEDICL